MKLSKLLSILLIGTGFQLQPATAKNISLEARADNISRGILWQAPEIPIEDVDLTVTYDEQWNYNSESEITCKWNPHKKINGMTKKFYCMTSDGIKLKVKYHGRKPNFEIQSEVLSTRLLSALGFGADKVFLVKKVRCIGCPTNPFQAAKAFQTKNAHKRKEAILKYGRQEGRKFTFPDYTKHQDFYWVALENKMPGKRLESKDKKGWKIDELNMMDASRGGAPVAHRDAIIIMLKFIMNSDYKAENQRMTCISDYNDDGYCGAPLMYLQDVGVGYSSGWKGLPPHRRVNLKNWKKSSIWKDRSKCLIELKSSPNAKRVLHQVTEEGRQFIYSKLAKLSHDQIYNWFLAARVTDPDAANANKVILGWTEAFFDKVQQIGDNPACPN